MARTSGSASRDGPTSPGAGSSIPRGLPQKKELAYAASIFRSIEINGTFYSMQRCESFAQWAEPTPDDFVFAVKGPRYLTHMLKLNNAEAPLGNFFASGPLRLGAKLGPILWQFPPSFRFNPEGSRPSSSCCRATPSRRPPAAARHDHRLEGRAWLESDRRRPIRHAMEIRHESFRDPAFIELLRKHDVALVCADTVEWPLLMDLTADFVYVPPARLDRTLRQRLQPAGARALGRAHRGLAQRQADDRRQFRPSPGSRGAGRATCSSTSTTPTSCRRPRMPCR